MKLYTEEHVGWALYNAVENPDLTHDNIISSLTPIELPGKEEIAEEAEKYPFIKHVDDGLYNDGFQDGLFTGANWVISKIKEQIN